MHSEQLGEGVFRRLRALPGAGKAGLRVIPAESGEANKDRILEQGWGGGEIFCLPVKEHISLLIRVL